MNRFITNSIRFFLDSCLPPIIRDNKYFMYPLFYIWFKGKNIKKIMDFKSRAFSMTKEEMAEFYQNRDSLATDRPTDLNEPSINYILRRFDTDAKTVLDVGCGNGYFINKVKSLGYEAWGCDMMPEIKLKNFHYVKADIENLPFEDKAFDIVTCNHTLEHIVNLDQAISELKRVAKKQLIIVVPCQRYYYYTLDEHIWFFPYQQLLEHIINLEVFTCQKIWGDWVYIGRIKS
ncbi:MAG TPA: hypothetical protein DCL61_16730 [Cyanobacteria bacterium UBA12227]|nr:hypothetical protein [Cyanobacteria bacterium UBA12227]HAX86988.1 hypothetical protein [Cyanobacteria bacterium UBA11370]HBY79828.1 hypothetical protein [Cyanobacteria bacterium UBA11148]